MSFGARVVPSCIIIITSCKFNNTNTIIFWDSFDSIWIEVEEILRNPSCKLTYRRVYSNYFGAVVISTMKRFLKACFV